MSFNAINVPIPGSRNQVPYVNGLTASFNTVTSLTLNPGSCSDSLNIIDLIVPSAITINATTQGINGIDDSDTLVANSVYIIFVIGDSSGFNRPAALISRSITPLLPYGYDCSRPVDIKVTNAVPNFILSYTNGQYSNREFVYDTPIQVLNGGTENTFTTIDLSNIAFAASKINFIASITPTAAGDCIILRPNNGFGTANAKLSSSVVGKEQIGELNCLPGNNYSIDYMLTAAGDVGSLWVKSYVYGIS